MIFILLFLLSCGYVVYYIVNLLIKKRMTENFTDQQMTIDDSHYFLTTSILPGKMDINNLKETNPSHTNYEYIDDESTRVEQTDLHAVSPRASKLSCLKRNDLTCITENDPARYLIQKYQPYMYDQAEIINYYDYPLYRDWRYPEQPIDIRFAVNPEKYVQQHPHVYPSYKHLSKW